MKKICKGIVEMYLGTMEGEERLKHYFDMTTHPGWAVHSELLAHMGNMLATTLLSKKFRDVKPEEKLVRLEAYSMVGEVLRFLLALPAHVNQSIKLKNMAGVTSMGATANKSPGATRKRGATKGGRK